MLSGANPSTATRIFKVIIGFCAEVQTGDTLLMLPLVTVTTPSTSLDTPEVVLAIEEAEVRGDPLLLSRNAVEEVKISLASIR